MSYALMRQNYHILALWMLYLNSNGMGSHHFHIILKQSNGGSKNIITQLSLTYIIYGISMICFFVEASCEASYVIGRSSPTGHVEA